MDSTQELVPTTYDLLRPDQMSEMVEERNALEQKLHNPRIEDKGVVKEQLRRLTRQFENQSPKPFSAAEVDTAVRREAELKEQILDGMLSQEEMRKCPHGAIDRHMAWEKKNVKKIQEWQNLKRRFSADGDDLESASIESFRPTTSNMNMDGALIQSKQFFLPPPNVGPAVTFNSADIATLRKHAPDIALRLATLTNEQRAEVKEVLAGWIEEAAT